MSQYDNMRHGGFLKRLARSVRKLNTKIAAGEPVLIKKGPLKGLTLEGEQVSIALEAKRDELIERHDKVFLTSKMIEHAKARAAEFRRAWGHRAARKTRSGGALGR